MAIQLATKFLPYVDELFSTESKKSILTNNDFDWSGAHTVKVYKITTAEMNDYNRNGTNQGSRYGTVQTLNATTEEFMLKKDRSFTFEIDKYVYKVMCENAGHKPPARELTIDNIYDEIISANSALDEAEVPETGRVLLVTPATYLLIKKNPEITLETELDNLLKVKGVISNLDGCAVVKVPSNRLPENFGFMLAHSVATVAPTKLEDYTTHTNPPGISGSLVEGRIVYDAFVLDNKAKAIYYQAFK